MWGCIDTAQIVFAFSTLLWCQLSTHHIKQWGNIPRCKGHVFSIIQAAVVTSVLYQPLHRFAMLFFIILCFAVVFRCQCVYSYHIWNREGTCKGMLSSLSMHLPALKRSAWFEKSLIKRTLINRGSKMRIGFY